MQNPIDVIEDMVASRDYSFHRTSRDEITLEINGRWSDYRVTLIWQDNIPVIQCVIPLDLRIPDDKIKDCYHLLGLINQRIGVGHFEVFQEEPIVAYRYAYLFVEKNALKNDLFDELIEITIDECERFYPALQFSLLGQKTPEEALQISLLDTVGEA